MKVPKLEQMIQDHITNLEQPRLCINCNKLCEYHNWVCTRDDNGRPVWNIVCPDNLGHYERPSPPSQEELNALLKRIRPV